MNIEYEIKSEITDLYAGKIVEGLEGKSKKQIDKYFDFKNNQLFIKGVFIRDRNGVDFEIKYNPNYLDSTHTVCNEYKYSKNLDEKEINEIISFLSQFSPDLGNIHLSSCSIYDLFKEVGLINYVTISKDRISYETNSKGVEISLDKVDNLGEFIELESISNLGKDEIIAIQDKFNLLNLPIGYVELYLRKHNKELYLKGRYLLDNDRK